MTKYKQAIKHLKTHFRDTDFSGHIKVNTSMDFGGSNQLVKAVSMSSGLADANLGSRSSIVVKELSCKCTVTP